MMVIKIDEFVVNPSNDEATLVQSTRPGRMKDAKIFENNLNPVMLVFIG